MQVRSIAAAVGVTALVVGGANVAALAATGQPLLLGGGNVAGKATTIKNSGSGPVLKLKGSLDQPPLSVSSSTKVTGLNADLIDGIDSSELARKSDLPAAQPTQPAQTAQPTPVPLTTTDLRFDVPANTTDILWTRRLPLGATGKYLLTYSASIEGLADDASGAAPLKGECYVVQSATNNVANGVFFTADETSYSAGQGEMSLSGSGVVDLAQGASIFLQCELNNGTARSVTWGTNPAEPIQVTITPLAAYARPANP